MIKSLKINNIALISECEIEFENGLNVLSGETGSGKSVIIDSINFLLGQKADKSMILNGETQCSATCVFDLSSSPKAVDMLKEIDVDVSDEIIVKRVFSESGRGSIKINGEPVTASMLRQVTRHLVDVHGQSDHFSLLNQSAQLDLIDQLAFEIVQPIKSEIVENISVIDDLNKQLKQVGGSKEDRTKRLDYLEYNINEIIAFDLKEDEEENLLAKRKLYRNLEKIMTAVSSSYECLNGDNGTLDSLGNAMRQLSSVASFGEEYSNLSERLEACMLEIQDVNSSLSDFLDGEFDQNEAERVEKRLEDISALKLKFGNNYQEIMAELEKMQKEFELISKSDEMAEKLNVELEKQFALLKEKYQNLSSARKEIAESLSKKLVESLQQLAMKHAQFCVSFSSDFDGRTLSKNGVDEVEFMFSANAGEPMKPLSRVISGGELSRLMLAIKTVTKNSCDANCYIFDEIDSGISGQTANVVAENFATISKSKQIIAISHLPQIVSMSDKSMVISKKESDGKTRTEVIACDGQRKISEVVRLVGGDEKSEHAVALAKQMIEKSELFKEQLNGRN